MIPRFATAERHVHYAAKQNQQSDSFHPSDGQKTSEPRLSLSFMHRHCTSTPAKVNDDAGAKAQYVLVIVVSVVKERDEVIGLDQP